jgi:hypothetical protein
MLLSCLVAFQFPIHNFAIYLGGTLSPQSGDLGSFRICTAFMNDKFSDLECSCVFCVETKNTGNFKSTNFRVFMQGFLKLRSACS